VITAERGIEKIAAGALVARRSPRGTLLTPGVTTDDLDAWRYLHQKTRRDKPRGYKGHPKAICIRRTRSSSTDPGAYGVAGEI
jgi:hypothetical protein